MCDIFTDSLIPAQKRKWLPEKKRREEKSREEKRREEKRREEKRRKDYAFRRQFNEKPSTITGCPGKWLPQHGTKCVAQCLYVIDIVTLCRSSISEAKGCGPATSVEAMLMSV